MTSAKKFVKENSNQREVLNFALLQLTSQSDGKASLGFTNRSRKAQVLSGCEGAVSSFGWTLGAQDKLRGSLSEKQGPATPGKH